MSDPWSDPPGGGEQPPPPPGGGAPPPPPSGSERPPPPPPPGWSPPPPTTPTYSATPPYGGGTGSGTGHGPTPAYTGPTSGSGQKTNVLAVASLVTGIMALLTCSGCGVLSIAALVTGVLGRNQIRESRGLEQGEGMALAGLITGGVGLAFGLLAGLVIVLSGG